MKHVAIVGASLAGVSAAEGLRESGFAGDITLLDAEPCLPYDKPPLSKGALRGVSRYAELSLHPHSWYEERDIALRSGTRVAALNPATATLQLDGGGELGYDGLVIATGSAARELPLPWPGEPSRLHLLRTAHDCDRLRADLVAGRHLVVIGAGFIGLEVAAVARESGLEVTVVEVAPTPLYRVFGPQVGERTRRLHERNGVTLRCGVVLQEIQQLGDHVSLLFADGSQLSADLVVAGLGTVPRTGWLAGSGIAVDNGIRCARDLSTGVPGVVAAGDIVRWHNSLFAEDMRIEHWTNAVEQGRHAARTLLGERADYCPVPYFWTDQYDAKMRFVGRASAGDDVVLAEPKPGALVALYGRGGVLRGAVCVRTPRRLAEYREAIRNRVSWHEAVAELRGNGLATAATTNLAPARIEGGTQI